MRKTSTVHLTINNLSSRANEEMLNPESAFDFEEEFADVFEVLKNLSVDIRQEVIENIVKTISENKK